MATSEGVLSSDPDSGSFRTDIAAAAVSALQSAGEDPFGEDWERREVELNENGD